MSVLGNGLHNTEIVIVCGREDKMYETWGTCSSIFGVGGGDELYFVYMRSIFKRGGSFIIILYLPILICCGPHGHQRPHFTTRKQYCGWNISHIWQVRPGTWAAIFRWVNELTMVHWLKIRSSPSFHVIDKATEYKYTKYKASS